MKWRELVQWRELVHLPYLDYVNEVVFFIQVLISKPIFRNEILLTFTYFIQFYLEIARNGTVARTGASTLSTSLHNHHIKGIIDIRTF